MMIESPEFPIDHQLKLVALQGDSGLREEMTVDGGRWAVADPDRAGKACVSLVDRAWDEHAHLALVPELAIPLRAVADLIEKLESNPEPLLVIGGVEGIPIAQYRDLVAQHGITSDIPDGAPGTFVNAMLVVLRTATALKIAFRAKRFASGPENAGGPQLALGVGPFLALRLGTAPFVVVPVICSEFVWPELWDKLGEEHPGLQIDVMPVLQRNWEVPPRHVPPVIHTAYQRNMQTRFILANQGLLAGSSDGTCFVVTPPASPTAPAFDLGRNELWLPNGLTYKGFRIPERTGCFWYAEVSHREGPMNATRPPVCGGRVLEVLTPAGVNLTGLPSGLMRSAAHTKHAKLSDPSWAACEVKNAYKRSLSATESAYLLRDTSRDLANKVFFEMLCPDKPTWETVEPLVDELIEAAALLACGGDEVRVSPCPGGNCSVLGRSVAMLYAPSIDTALSERFSEKRLLSGTALPAGLVLLRVQETARNPRARSVGDVLRADRVSSESPGLIDGPVRVSNSSVTVGLGDLRFCEPRELRPSLNEATLTQARSRTSLLLPGVYACETLLPQSQTV